MLAITPLLGYLPMASLAALLLVVAYNMSEIRHAVRVLRIGPRSDGMVLATCFALTVLFDMVISVSVGVVLAALLFMRRMAEMATVRLLSESHPSLPEPLPKGVLLYEISGPLFFGAAQKAVSAMRAIASDVHLVILDLRAVPTMDATGLVNLDSALESLHKSGKIVVIAGVQAEPLKLMAKAGWHHRPWLVVLRSFEESIWLARSLAPADYDGLSDAHVPLAAHHAV
jgi:SulP family sulfate permease